MVGGDVVRETERCGGMGAGTTHYGWRHLPRGITKLATKPRGKIAYLTSEREKNASFISGSYQHQYVVGAGRAFYRRMNCRRNMTVNQTANRLIHLAREAHKQKGKERWLRPV